MGRGRIRAAFRDILRPGDPLPTKDGSFSAQSIPNADPAVFRELKAAIAKIEARYGIDLPQANLGFTDDGRGFIGVHFGSGDSRTVLFNRAFYNRSQAEIIKDMERAFKSKFSVDSHAPLQYVAVHEFGHSIWVDRVEGRNPRLKVLNDQIERLYSNFRSDVRRGRNPVSDYAHYNINEFVAESFTQGVLGKRKSKYSRAILRLFKKNRKLLTTIR